MQVKLEPANRSAFARAVNLIRLVDAAKDTITTNIVFAHHCRLLNLLTLTLSSRRGE